MRNYNGPLADKFMKETGFPPTGCPFLLKKRNRSGFENREADNSADSNCDSKTIDSEQMKERNRRRESPWQLMSITEDHMSGGGGGGGAAGGGAGAAGGGGGSLLISTPWARRLVAKSSIVRTSFWSLRLSREARILQCWRASCAMSAMNFWEAKETVLVLHRWSYNYRNETIRKQNK